MVQFSLKDLDNQPMPDGEFGVKLGNIGNTAWRLASRDFGLSAPGVKLPDGKDGIVTLTCAAK